MRDMPPLAIHPAAPARSFSTTRECPASALFDAGIIERVSGALFMV